MHKLSTRLTVVGLTAGLFVALFAGTALAEDRILDQATCEDGNLWAGGSQIINGVWNASTSTCDAFYVEIESDTALDQLTIPAGTTLVTTSSVNVAFGGTLINNGTIAADDVNVVQATLTNNGAITIVDTLQIIGGPVDNYGSMEMVNLTLTNSADLVNHCGATLTYETLTNQVAPTQEEPCDTTTTTSSTSTTITPTSTTTTLAASTTTTIAAASTTVAPTTTILVAATEATLPFTGVDDRSGPIAYAGLALVAVGLFALILTGIRGRTDNE